jgi:hypothetical protein
LATEAYLGSFLEHSPVQPPKHPQILARRLWQAAIVPMMIAIHEIGAFGGNTVISWLNIYQSLGEIEVEEERTLRPW